MQHRQALWQQLFCLLRICSWTLKMVNFSSSLYFFVIVFWFTLSWMICVEMRNLENLLLELFSHNILGFFLNLILIQNILTNFPKVPSNDVWSIQSTKVTKISHSTTLQRCFLLNLFNNIEREKKGRKKASCINNTHPVLVTIHFSLFWPTLNLAGVKLTFAMKNDGNKRR